MVLRPRSNSSTTTLIEMVVQETFRCYNVYRPLDGDQVEEICLNPDKYVHFNAQAAVSESNDDVSELVECSADKIVIHFQIVSKLGMQCISFYNVRALHTKYIRALVPIYVTVFIFVMSESHGHLSAGRERSRAVDLWKPQRDFCLFTTAHVTQTDQWTR